jgi:multidrug resistance efflux pump
VDDRHLRAQRELQAASLRVAEAELARLAALPRTEELPPSAAKVKAAAANVRLWQDQAERSERLITARVVSEEQHVERKLKLEVAEQEFQRARAEDDLLQAGAWTRDIDVARAQVELAKAQLAQIETEIERSVVRAPVDGTLLQVNVRPGEYVGASAGQTLVLLGDSRELHVRVEIDENDIPRFQPGLNAKAFVRGDGASEVPLRFVRVEPYVQPKRWLTSDNTERVDTRVLQVIYAVQPCSATLYVGQTLDVYIELPESR